MIDKSGFAFNQHILPLLNAKKVAKIDNSFLAYLHHMSHFGWRNFKGDFDSKNLLLVKYLCEESYKHHSSDFLELLAILSSEQFEMREQRGRLEESLKRAFDSKNNEDIIAELLREYHLQFETELRFLLTIPYFYAVHFYGKNTKKTKNRFGLPKDIPAFFRIPASKKLNLMLDVAVPTPKGELKNLVRGIVAEIRNGGVGHNTWMILESGKVEIKNIDPNTGKEKTASLVLSQDELKEECTKLKHRLWVLEMGMTLFLAENNEVRQKTSDNRKIKPAEIREILDAEARPAWFYVRKLESPEDRKEVSIELLFKPEILGIGIGKIYSDVGCFDLPKVKQRRTLEEVCLYILSGLIEILSEVNESLIHVLLFSKEAFDDPEKEIGNFKIKLSELRKIRDKPGTKLNLEDGSLPEGDYVWEKEVQVPAGMGEEYQKNFDAELEQDHPGH